jgi:hypothetical protein
VEVYEVPWLQESPATASAPPFPPRNQDPT